MLEKFKDKRSKEEKKERSIVKISSNLEDLDQMIDRKSNKSNQ